MEPVVENTSRALDQPVKLSGTSSPTMNSQSPKIYHINRFSNVAPVLNLFGFFNLDIVAYREDPKKVVTEVSNC